MGKIIVHNAIIPEKGFLYYIDAEENLCSAEMKNKKKKEDKKE